MRGLLEKWGMSGFTFTSALITDRVRPDASDRPAQDLTSPA